MTGSIAALYLALALYLSGAALLGANLFLRRTGLLVTGRSVATAAALAHTLAIGLRCAELKQAPFTTPGEALSALAWMITLAYLLSDILWRLWAVGPFALGLSFLLVIGAGFSAHNAGASQTLLESRAISLHIIAILASFGAFSLAFCCAVLYLLEHHILKSKQHLLWLRRLPPLLTVENAAFTLVAIGFPLLTLGILSGLMRAWAGDLPHGWYRETHSLLAFAVWGIYGLYLLARLRAGWPPVRTSYVLLFGLALCLLLFFVPSAAHRFG